MTKITKTALKSACRLLDEDRKTLIDCHTVQGDLRTMNISEHRDLMRTERAIAQIDARLGGVVGKQGFDAMSFRSTISTAKLERNRASKAPTKNEVEQAAREFPDNSMKAAMRAINLASDRNHKDLSNERP